ncbi:glycosyl transferase family 28 [Gloeothece citriformis PCC 7424]|uniref:Glycosyl transferase family 28 n=1 Tax=Gloeothece citriformis (strain PCC 7424) TaxID=65393 RepID=B7KD16_GLOC7|nr:glycosyltransferase [Gloeothece citriformis]ACK73137.1 glycosyl transferase family 28 [Gloeothece citriformis PCC 7424]
MSRIVLTTIGSLGDLHPFIAIAFELRNRGHDVVFATHQEYQDKIESVGFEFHRMRPNNTALNDPQEMARMMDVKTGTEYVIKHWVCQHLSETYSDVLTVAQDADFILTSEGVVAARLVAEKLGIRWGFAVLQPASFLSVYDPSVLPVLPFLAKFRGLGAIANRGIIQLSKLMSNSWGEPIHQLRRELGLPPLNGNPFIEDKYSPYLVLALFSSSFAQPQPDWPANTAITGFPFYDGSESGGNLTPELEEFLAAGEPPIVFTLGSAAVITPGEFYEESIEALKGLKRRGVLLMGKKTPPETLSDNIIAVNYAPYSLIFPRACAIVHQGGIGTTAQALRAGRPTLVIPYTHDQPDNAARVERLGTSRTIPRQQYRAARVAQELEKLLENPNYGTVAAKIARIIAAEDGVKVACDRIESII